MIDFLYTLQESMSWIAPFLVVLTVLVFFHELGHYLVAVRYGVKVEVFSIGFGPALFRWHDKRGTRWQFSLIPLGGYVRMYGDDNAASVPKEQADVADYKLTLHAKHPFQKTMVAVAGPVANLILTVIFLAIVFIGSGEKQYETSEVAGLHTSFHGQGYDVKPGDYITNVNGMRVKSYRGFLQYVGNNPEKPLVVTLKRHGLLHKVSFPASESHIVPLESVRKKYGAMESVWRSCLHTSRMTKRFFVSIYQMIMGGQGAGKLGGLPSIAKMAHDTWQGGAYVLLTFMAVLSLNLGLLNLLPIPMLDGGHIVMYILEWVRGKPLAQKTQNWVFRLGLYALLSLMVYAHWNDAKKFKLVSWVTQKVEAFV